MLRRDSYCILGPFLLWRGVIYDGSSERMLTGEPFHHHTDDGPASIVEMLFCTSLVALVGTADAQPSSSPRRLQIVNTKVSRLTPQVCLDQTKPDDPPFTGQQHPMPLFAKRMPEPSLRRGSDLRRATFWLRRIVYQCLLDLSCSLPHPLFSPGSFL